MNLVGKILTVLIFVMSLIFATMALMVYATHTNWQEAVKKQSAELTELRQARDKLKEQMDQMEIDRQAEQKATTDQIAALETQVAKVTTERDAQAKEIQELNKSTAEAVAAMTATQATLADLRTEVGTLREDIRKARQDRDESFKKAVALADQAHQLQTEQKRLEARLSDLVVDRNRMRDLLRANDLDPAADPAGALPKVEGVVTALVQGGTLEISIGSDDGLNKGHRLEIYRSGAGNSTYLGRVEVMRTLPDKAVCKIIPEFRKGAIQVGDRVASKLE